MTEDLARARADRMRALTPLTTPHPHKRRAYLHVLFWGLVAWLVVMAILVALPFALTKAHASETTVWYRLHGISAEAWSASSVMSDWSASPLLDARLTTTCQGHKPCIHVYTTHLDTDVVGLARFYSGRWTIIVDPYQADTARLRHATLCHEVGHTLGLNHMAHGCMTATVYAVHPSPWQTAHAFPPTYSTGETAPQHEDKR